ncbi:28S ribosomal protein S15, mitochondrial isoform X1 [Camelus ferus]|uniref:Small ribosomal subunit protein uS15m n=2 Tax=Camelus TaxID=9836 RepID=A0A8B7KBU4_CAMFR|nr:28S ribosomal protein S15, mitochondrial isoform X1 [Camelus bactrianus]XP_014416088.1 28S ribosomal protein S15, mitochondrial isoform X1 [Camelus ferus]
MLRAAWRALSSIRTQVVTQVPVLGLPGGTCARLSSVPRGLPSPPGGEETRSSALGVGKCSSAKIQCLILQAARGYATQKPVQPSQEDDLAPSMLLKDYQDIPGIEKVDDVVKRLLSLEMANQKEKLKIKKALLMNKVAENPEDTRSLEARIVALTVKIHSYEDHMQKHRKDKAHKRYLQMSIDQRKKMLKNLRNTNYAVFEKTCRELGLEYTPPPLHHRRAHRRLATKKALCIRVFQEVQKLKKQKRALKAAAAAAREQGQKSPKSPFKARPEATKENQ